MKKALEYLSKAKDLWEELNDPLFLCVTYAHFAELKLLQRKFEQAVKYSQEAVKLARDAKSEEKLIRTLRIYAKVLAETGADFRCVEKLFKESINRGEKLNIKLDTGISMLELAKFYKDNGKYKDSQKYLKRAKGIFTKSGSVYMTEKISKLKWD